MNCPPMISLSLLSSSVSSEAGTCGAGVLGDGRVYGGGVRADLRESTTLAKTGGKTTRVGKRVLVSSELQVHGEAVEGRS